MGTEIVFNEKYLTIKAIMNTFFLIVLLSMMCSRASAEDGVITFADATVKNLCVTNWDTDGDGELSFEEAQAVKTIGTVFRLNETIISFDELRYFTSISSLEMYAFYNCSSLESIVLPPSVNMIGKYAFKWCSSLQRVVLSESLLSIAEQAFNQCVVLTEISLPDGLQSIGFNAFQYCKELESIVIPASVTSIDGNCFTSCYNLKSIVVDESNTKYNSGEGANAIIETKTNRLITGCQSTIIPATVTIIVSDAFSDCPLLTSIEIPNSVTTIGGWAFCACTGLTNVKLSDSLHYIGPYAFASCSTLTSIEIPNSVTTIGEYAFYDSYCLRSVTSRITDVFATGANAFLNCGNAKLYVQGDLIEQYRSTSDWKRLANIEAIPATVMLSCNDGGKVSLNGGEDMSTTISELIAMDGAVNSFVFTPNENCQLEQVLIDDNDVTKQVTNNTLNAVLNDGSKVIVSFRDVHSDMDVNHDGNVDISDVVTLVNFILEH